MAQQAILLTAVALPIQQSLEPGSGHLPDALWDGETRWISAL